MSKLFVNRKINLDTTRTLICVEGGEVCPAEWLGDISSTGATQYITHAPKGSFLAFRQDQIPDIEVLRENLDAEGYFFVFRDKENPDFYPIPLNTWEIYVSLWEEFRLGHARHDQGIPPLFGGDKEVWRLARNHTKLGNFLEDFEAVLWSPQEIKDRLRYHHCDFLRGEVTEDEWQQSFILDYERNLIIEHVVVEGTLVPGFVYSLCGGWNQPFEEEGWYYGPLELSPYKKEPLYVWVRDPEGNTYNVPFGNWVLRFGLPIFGEKYLMEFVHQGIGLLKKNSPKEG